jgi:hypothetical protein
MSKTGPSQISLATGVCVAFLAILACNAPFGREEATPTTTLEPTETATGVQQATLEPAQTAAPAVDTATASKPTATSEPTATIAEQPTLAPTLTPSPSHTPRPTATRQVEQTITPTSTGGNDGPLSFTYQIVWKLKDEHATQAIATVSIFATGGGGEYRYFRDDLQVAGSVFEYEWSTCSGNPGSLRVDSADGQSVRTEYYENSPCPTPTPQR